jgi:two-component system sensor histidine kinase PilS (NtrC family)
MLSSIPDMTPEHRQLLDIVTRESQRLNSIITNFLAYSRGKQYRFEKVDLVPLLEDTLTLMRHRMIAEDTRIVIEDRFDEPKAWTLADGDKIKQVFWNFGENAVRAMQHGGTLRVGLERLGDDWQVTFADTGTGMTPQQTEKIFEPFQSNFEGGTGLGLAVVYQIVQAHEGKVWARSKPGQGSTFVLRLRRLEADRQSLKNVASENLSVSGGADVVSPPLAASAGGTSRG